MPSTKVQNTQLSKGDESMAKVFDFSLIKDWQGYNSALDPTSFDVPNVMVQGSQNIYKKIAGTLAVRPGLKKIGPVNAAISPVSSEFIWNTSLGFIYPVWVANGNLQFYYNGAWYTLLSGITNTRWIFDKWFNPTQQQDVLLGVNGTSTMYMWTGGVAIIANGNNNSGVVSQVAATPTSGGSGYVIGDVLNITTGGTGAQVTVTSLGTGGVTGASVAFGGTGYQVDDIITVASPSPSTGLQLHVDTVSGGVITGISIVAEGTNYITGTFNASGGSGVNAVITISGVAIAGVITGLSLTAAGTGYSTGTGKSTSGGTGTGATVNILAVAQGIINVSGTVSPSALGFYDAGSLTVGSTVYTYQAIVGTSFIGININPTGVSGVGFQTLSTFVNTPAQNFNANFIKVIENQVWVGSYTSRICYVSADGQPANGDFTNYVVPNPEVDGSPAHLDFDSNLNGIGVNQENIYVSCGTSEWVIVAFSDTVINNINVRVTTQTSKVVAKEAAALAHEFISNSGDTIVYLSQDQQLRAVGNFNQSFVNAFPALSQDVFTELSNEDFTGGCVKSIGDFTYITAPVSGKTYLYQVRQSVNPLNEVVVERLWHSPFVISATRVDDYNGTVVVFSNANPMMYQLFDTNQWYDDSPSGSQLPYDCKLALAYNTADRRQGIQNFDKIFSEGYMGLGTPLTVTVNYNYQGATQTTPAIVNSIAQPATFFSPSIASLGDTIMGDKPLGDEINEDDTNNGDLPKFKVINSLALINCFEYQLVYESDTANANWELLASGTNTRLTSQNATFIINKKPLTN